MMMRNGNSPRSDDAIMVGVSLVALAAAALSSYAFRVTDTLVAATCGAAPARNAVTMDAYIAFLHCEDATANRYWMVVCVAVGIGLGYAARAWLRREARRDAARDRKLDAEMERIRAADEHHDT
jgi:hypothetical protein